LLCSAALPLPPVVVPLSPAWPWSPAWLWPPLAAVEMTAPLSTPVAVVVRARVEMVDP
jgi:hypothetical protein